MGTYLVLELEDKSDRNIAKANALWTYENQEKGYRTAVHFRTRQDQLADMEYMELDESQKHLRGKSIDQLEDMIGDSFKKGIFKQKITFGDYLCSEMARRLLDFIENHSKMCPFKTMVKEVTSRNDFDCLFGRPRDRVMSILQDKASSDHRAKDCFADCPYCRGASSQD